MTSARNRRSVTRKLAMSIAITLILAAGVEACCRIVRPDERWFEDPYKNANTLFRTLRYDAALGWAGRPFAKVMHLDERLNSRGLRGPEFPDEKPAGAVRILALGDSATYNVQYYDVNRPVPLIILEDPYPALLGVMLDAYNTPDRKFEVINGGTPGYSSLQGLRLLKLKGLRWDPDVVLIRFGWNDHWFRDENYTLRPEPRNAVVRWVLTQLFRSRFYTFLNRLAQTAIGQVPSATPAADWPEDAPPPGPADLRVPPEEFEFNLRLMIHEARRHGAVPIVINAPAGEARPSFINGPWFKPFLKSLGYGNLEDVFKVHAGYNAIAAKVAGEEGTPFIDLDAAFAARGRGELFGPTEVLHPNREGNELAARLVLQELQRLGIVPAVAPARGHQAPAREGKSRLDQNRQARKVGT